MHTDIKQQWVAALRSGEYDQTIGALRSKDNRFCCLGVLCDIFNKDGWKQLEHGSYTYMGEDANVPPQVCVEVDLNIPQIVLIDLNDNQGKTFAEIADFIEQST